MGFWIEENLPALLFGAGMGGIVVGWFYPHGFVWMLGSLAGVGLAVPIWQINKDRWMNRDH